MSATREVPDWIFSYTQTPTMWYWVQSSDAIRILCLVSVALCCGGWSVNNEDSNWCDSHTVPLEFRGTLLWEFRSLFKVARSTELTHIMRNMCHRWLCQGVWDIFIWKSEGRTPLGRPKRNWEDNTLMANGKGKVALVLSLTEYNTVKAYWGVEA
jgi:hypothetical protein